MRPDEHRWHGSADALAHAIEAATVDLLDLLGKADEILQSEQMPQPWERWQGAVDACQDAWGHLANGGDVDEGARRTCAALRKSGIANWPPAAVAEAAEKEPDQ